MYDDKNKYLIRDSADMAQMRIDDIRDNLIPIITDIASAIRAFDVPVTKVNVINAIHNPNAILDMHNKMFEKKHDEWRKMMGDEMFQKMYGGMNDEKLRTLCDACEKFKTSEHTFMYNCTPISNPVVLNWFIIGNDGNPVIPEWLIDTIRKEGCEYIKTAVGKELRDLQIDVASKLEKMYRRMEIIMEMPKKTLDYDARGVYLRAFPGGLFEYKRTETGHMEIIPRNINFDPVSRDEVS